MSLAEDPWRPSAGGDHILCGAFKKRPLGGTGHIRVLAHFPKGRKIIRCAEPNSTNPIHNYTHRSNKLCHVTEKWNYSVQLSITCKEKKKSWRLKCSFWGVRDRRPRTWVIFFIFFFYLGVIEPPIIMLEGWFLRANSVSFIQGGIYVSALLPIPQAFAMTLTDISLSFLRTHLKLNLFKTRLLSNSTQHKK